MMKLKISPGIILANLTVIGLAIITVMNMSTIQPIYPFDGMVIHDRNPSFEWTGMQQSYNLMIDDNPGFESSLEFTVTGNVHQLEQQLDFGEYWWKLESDELETKPRQFTLVSTVALSRMNQNVLRNSGNTDLLVHRSSLLGAITLAVNQTIKICEEENVKAEQL
jgi:hypothetical protein